MSTPRLARRLDGVSESATLRLNAAVQAMKARGEDVINLTAGEPDFDPPAVAEQAIIDAVRAHRSKYTPVPGIPELRKLVAEKTNAQQPSVIARARPWQASDVVVSNGGKQALFNSFLTLLDPGDEVIIPAPYWLSYPEMVRLASGTPKIVETGFEDRYKLTPAKLRAAIGPRTRALIINSPSNPTGGMYARDELAALGQVLAEAQGRDGRDAANPIWVLSDEIYDRIVLGETPFCSFGEACPELRDQVITVNGMSKSAAMTGWRIGWTVAPEAITQGIQTLQGQSTSGINSLAQWASVAALKLEESEFAEQRATYRRRRDLALEILSKAGKIKVFPPDGAFYVFVGIGSHLKPGEDSLGFAERLLAQAKVAVVPGTPFGSPDSMRLSFAMDDASLAEGCRRIVAGLAQM